MKNNFQSKAVPRGTRTIWRYLGALFLLFTFAIGNVLAVDYSPLNYNGGSTLPSGYKYYGSSTGVENKSAFSTTTYQGHTVFDVTAGGTGAYNKRAIEFTVSEDCTLDIEFYVGNDGRKLNLFHGNSTVVHSSTGTTKGDNKYTFSYSFEGITSDQTYSLSGSGSKVYISKITFAPAVDCTETAPTSVAVSGGATYDKGDALSNLSAVVTGGTGTMSYQWYRNTTNAATVSNELKLANCTTATLAPSNKVGTYYYYCVASNCAGSVTSGTTAVTINPVCPPSGTIYKFQVKTGLTNGNLVTSVPKDVDMTTDNYLSALVGGELMAAARANVNRINITGGNAIGFANGADAYLEMTLDCAIQAGDIIKYTVASNNMLLRLTSASTEENQLTLDRTKTQVEVPAAFVGATKLYMIRASSSPNISYFEVFRPVYRTITLEYADGVTPDGSLEVVDGEAATKPADPTWEHHRFDGWYNGASPYDWASTVSGDLTLTAHWTQLYTVTYAKGDESATGDAPTQADKAATETFEVAANSFEVAGKVFDYWNDGTNNYNPGDTYTVGTNNVTLTAVWRTPSTMYAITKGAHENGDFTINPASQEAGEVVTLEATPDADYLFSAWEVVKTEDGTDAGVTVTNGEFTMPAFAVTVNATFVADPRKKVLYVTSTAEATVKENDKLYDALKDIYNVSIVGPTSEADQTNYDLVVLHESIGGSSYNAAAVAAAKTGSTPVLNTKSYFYNDGRFGWGAPNAGQSVKGATLNSAYCNIASHPLFDGLTITDGFFEITDEAAAKCMQPVGSFTSGKEGYTLATTPNSGEGNGCAIHELTPAQRGASAGKYLMISVSNDKLNALNANGQKLFQNAAAYLIGSSEWSPILVPTTPEITGTTAYSAGETIELTASATGESTATTYTWYKGATLEAAKEAGAIQAAKTIAENGNVYSKADCVVGDAGTYWCVISNGTDCEANASVEITVSDASYNASFVSAHGTAPVATSGVSYTLPELTESGYVHQGWTANIDVTVDEAVVTAGTTIANGKTAIFGADVTFTAVWKQIFAVTFNLNGQSGSIAPQDIIDGEKATKPADPVVIGWDFGGWFTDAACTAGNEFDFNTAITEAKELFAKWTEFDGCTLLVPATSGENAGVGDAIVMQTGSKGATMTALAIPDGGSLAYTANGLAFNKKSGVKTNVVLNNDMKVGTKISLKLVAGGDKTRGLFLYTKTGTKIEAFTCWVEGVNPAVENEEETFTYTVVADDGLEGTNEFQLWRNNTVYLKQLAVTECGAAVVYHNLTSAVDPAGKGTVTLDASSVREGLTTKATYSDIDPLYEFVSWSVSGAGASIADASANPATITVGTEDAVVTLNLQLIPVKYTVNYFDGTTPMGTEQVAVNEHPTASEIETAKRHYTFLGWSLTDGGDIVALNTITRTEATTVDLFAKYEAVVCPTSGTIFSMEFDETKKPGETVTIAKDASIDLAEYATISGGNAMIINGETSGKDAISTDGEFLLKATKEVMKIELNCVLQEGDIIRIPDNSAKLVISTSNAKTGTYQAFADKNTHEFAVTAAWAGVDDIYVLYDGSSLKFTKVYVIRPAKFDVSFNMMGHGTQIADIEDVIEGSKITAPAAPTDEDYSFAGWYKENTLANEWKFDVDVVEANTTLYAKWLDKSDATLKSLMYGAEEITLQAGVYTYNVTLPAFTSAVPALTAETSNPNATKVIANAAAFDSEGNATSTVTVTPEVGADQVYTVKFAKGVEILLQDVTGSITWNFANAVTGTVNITGTPQVLANYGGVTNDNTFESDKLEASGEKFTTGSNANLRANYIRFHTTVPGILSISYSNTGGSNPARYIYVNGVKYDEEGSASTTKKGLDNKVFVPAGDVELVMKDGEDASKNVQIYQMIFNATPDYTRPVTEGRYGTICLPNGGVMTNATIYTLAYFGETSQKFFFDEVLGGVMEAGKPYLFFPHEGATQLGVYYTDSENKSGLTVNGFVGFIGADADAYTQVPANDNCYIISNNLYRQVQTGAEAYILSNRAYIDMTKVTNVEPAKAPGARRIGLGVQGKDQAQGFENIETGDAPMKVMINGTMYILRGEKVYDATGRLVK